MFEIENPPSVEVVGFTLHEVKVKSGRKFDAIGPFNRAGLTVHLGSHYSGVYRKGLDLGILCNFIELHDAKIIQRVRLTEDSELDEAVGRMLRDSVIACAGEPEERNTGGSSDESAFGLLELCDGVTAYDIRSCSAAERRKTMAYWR